MGNTSLTKAPQKTSKNLTIQIRNRELQASGEYSPDEIGNIGIHDPAEIWQHMPQNRERPDERPDNQENIDRRKQIILESKLNRCESKIKNKIECKRHGNHPVNLLRECLIKHGAKRNSNNQI